MIDVTANSAAPHNVESAGAAGHVPGEVGVWVLIFGEMVFFSTLFVAYLIYRAKDPALFAASQRALDKSSGVLLTLVLLTASFFVVMGVRAVRRGLRRAGRRFLLAAVACGVLFSVLKFLEYRHKIGHHLTPNTNDFYMMYYMLTGFHWLHVVLGITVLMILYRFAGKEQLSPGQFVFFEGGACYWHMVDVLWIIIFPLLYLVK